MPKIPAQPIGYDDAKIIMEKIGGRDPPESWKGGIEGVRYALGDAPAQGRDIQTKHDLCKRICIFFHLPFPLSAFGTGAYSEEFTQPLLSC